MREYSVRIFFRIIGSQIVRACGWKMTFIYASNIEALYAYEIEEVTESSGEYVAGANRTVDP
jgi:hypothetical protein